MKTIKNLLTKKTWSVVVLFGLFGQLAWMIENMYFNVFVNKTITTDPGAITQMVFWSALTATLTTLFMGALSDKLGKRKGFMVGGYILWGISTMAFAFIRVENIQHLGIKNAVQVAVVAVIIMDCVMTFFGSTAYDAVYNAWINDVTPKEKRGRVETVIAVMPLLAMGVIFGVFDVFTQNNQWSVFFGVLGAVVTIGGVIGIFIIEESPDLKPKSDTYFQNMVYGFRPKVVKSNIKLYIAMILLAVLNTSAQIYMPYLIIYIEQTLKITNYVIPLAVILLLSAVLSVLAGPVIDKVTKRTFVIPAIVVTTVGLVAMYFVGKLGLPLIVAGVLLLGGNMVVGACIMGFVRDYTPKESAGHFQGIRMLFYVLIPMTIGPAIGEIVIKSGEQYIDQGKTIYVPGPQIFLASAGVMVVVLVATLLATTYGKLGKEEAERKKEGVLQDGKSN